MATFTFLVVVRKGIFSESGIVLRLIAPLAMHRDATKSSMN